MADDQPVRCYECVDALEILHLHRSEDDVVPEKVALEARAHIHGHKRPVIHKMSCAINYVGEGQPCICGSG